MSTVPARPQAPSRASRTGPAWEIATFFPNQGEWSDEEYLALPTSRLVELTDGRIEVLPMPTRLHQKIVAFLYAALQAFTRGRGEVYFAPLPLRLRPGKWREPDLIFVALSNKRALEGEYLNGADLVMEVVSRPNAWRDRVKKRKEYAQAGISEYWLVDPERRTVTVLSLDGPTYRVAGCYASGENAESVLLAGFKVDVRKALAGG